MTINAPEDKNVNAISDLKASTANPQDFLGALRKVSNYNEAHFNEVRVLVMTATQGASIIPTSITLAVLRFAIHYNVNNGIISKQDACALLAVLDTINWVRFDFRLMEDPKRLKEIISLLALPENGDVGLTYSLLESGDFIVSNLRLVILAAQQANNELWRFVNQS